MTSAQSVLSPREVKIYFIDDDGPSVVEQFLEWWRKNRRPGIEAKPELHSEPPWLDEATQKAIEEFKPDLIVLDLVLQEGEGSGERALRKLKTSKQLRDVPVFIYSSNFPLDSEQRTNAERKYKAIGAERLYDKARDANAFDAFVDFALKRQQNSDIRATA